MYQYKEYTLQYTDSATLVRDPAGNVIGYFENDAEAAEYIDSIFDTYSIEVDTDVPKPKLEPAYYFAYRIARNDKDCYDNYQYFDGRHFRYSGTAKRMTKADAEEICRKYMRWDSLYVYHVSK